MLFWILVIIWLVICYLSIFVRVVSCNPLKTAGYSVKDVYKYFRYKLWRLCSTGQIIAYVGLFGKGKTLSAVHKVVGLYKQYNNRKVFDFSRMRWVTQKVHVISNVSLSIPYEDFKSLVQIVQIADRYKKIDEDENTLTVHIVLGDEFSVQLNSRSFKSNIDPLFLNTLLTCRHHHISLIYTAQRFNQVDALLRQVTSYVINCNKCWRVMIHGQYDAYELENAKNVLDVRPMRRFGWFIRDDDFNAYDTLACVNNLSRSCREGDMLSESEILALQQNQSADMDSVVKPSKQYIRRKKKMNGRK